MIFYDEFMMDIMRESRSDELKYMKLDEEKDAENKEYIEFTYFDEGSKEGVFKENFYLRDNLQKPLISPKLKKERIREEIIDFTGRFIDSHATQLSTSGPVYIFTFGEKEIKPIYDLLELTPEMMLEFYTNMINETYYGKISAFITGWVKNAPHKIMLTSILADAVQNNYADVVTCCEYLWAFCEYPIIYREFWKTGVKEDVMNYTIEHLSSKNIVTQVKNLQELLKYDANKTVAAYMSQLQTGVDNMYIDLMYRMRNQIKSKLKNIAIAYYKNSEENNTQHNNVSQFDDGEIADVEGHSTNVAQIVDKTNIKFSSAEINNTMARIAADGNKVDKNNLIGYISQIYSTKNNRLPKMVENIITYYFSKNPTNSTVGDGEFLNYGLALFRSISSSKDTMLQEVKDILSFWMNDIIDIGSQYDRPATITNYTRAVYNYIIFMIQYYN